jgi:hypothetical protein
MMVDLPLEILLLIADHFEPTEVRSLAAFHRYFLYAYLREQYRRPIVLTDSLQGELGKTLKTDLERIL